ncbi:TPA: FtsQ-type POTRA domain-containing protein [Candidatus Poribacteria bacterium]|nr:FtsQ-type POTRA domain-containing protein [Candidatus Poribacteria bacterium]
MVQNMPKSGICRLVFIFIAIIVVIAGGYHSILQSDVFLLEKIVVKGNNRVPTEKIISASGMQIGVDKISSISDEEIEKRLLKGVLYIKHVDIKTEIPSTLIIDVVEREPVAIIPFYTTNRKLYGLVDVEGFILEIVDQSNIPEDMIILTGVMKEFRIPKFPLFLDDSLYSYFSKRLEEKAFQIAQNTLKKIIMSDLSSEILSINTKDANKITLKLKNDSVVWLSSDYLEDELYNFKTVFLYHKDKNEHYDYIDARFGGVVYCGRNQK